MRRLVQLTFVLVFVGVLYLTYRAVSSFVVLVLTPPCSPPCTSPLAAGSTATASSSALVEGGDSLPPGLNGFDAAATATAVVVVVPNGSVVEDGALVATPAPAAPSITARALIQRYGTTLFPSIEAMPEDARLYFTDTVDEVTAFFGVRPQDAILLLERGGGGLRIHWGTDESTAEPVVPPVPPRLWNGWANPERVAYISDPRSIEQYGGVGFEWATRINWTTWMTGRMRGDILTGIAATPDGLEDVVAAISRYLLQYGLTSERAGRDPDDFEQRLADATARFDTELATSTTAASLAAAPVAAAASSISPPLRATYRIFMDDAFGVGLTDADLAAFVDASPVAAAVLAGQLGAEDGARQLFEQTVQSYLTAGVVARTDGLPLPWPFVYDEATLAAQRLAVQHLGHTLAPWQVAALLQETNGDPAAVATELEESPEAEVYDQARTLLDTWLKRGVRGQPLFRSEVAAVVQPVLGRWSLSYIGQRDQRLILGEVEQRMRLLPEFRDLYGDMTFAAAPLSPMPDWILQPFGVPARYQPGGLHTGLDLRGPRVRGEEPPIFAVDDGTVVHVGPIYCEQEGSCRGSHAVIIDHGNNVYSLYSHNSAASVQPGERVVAGQEIGRQGNEGYSRGSHLHLEVHVGGAWTGNWTQPFNAGEFVDPYPWLPWQAQSRW